MTPGERNINNAAQGQAKVEPPGLTRRKVLVVDDDESVRGMLEAWLYDAGYAVESAANGDAGLGLLREQAPDVLITDILMPAMDGYEFCRLVRETSEVPILVYTSVPENEGKAASLKAGANDYAVKNTSMKAILDRIEALVTAAK